MAGGVPRALRPHRRLQWADRSVEPEDQEHQAHRARIPQLRQLPAPPPSQPRPNPEQSSDITDPNPPSQLGGVEPPNPPPKSVVTPRRHVHDPGQIPRNFKDFGRANFDLLRKRV